MGLRVVNVIDEQIADLNKKIAKAKRQDWVIGSLNFKEQKRALFTLKTRLRKARLIL